jgi:vacuolar-type H+-ATPase subunit I/STV1
MSTLSTTKRLKIALGGFVSFTGFIILILVVLAGTGAADLSVVFHNEFLMAAILALGFIDIFCGILLAFTNTRLKLSFASQKKKPDNDVE